MNRQKHESKNTNPRCTPAPTVAALLIAALCILCTAQAGASTISVGSDRDNFIYPGHDASVGPGEVGYNSEMNWGAFDSVVAGPNNNPGNADQNGEPYRGLLGFDLSSLGNVDVSDATLTLTVTNTSKATSATADFNLYLIADANAAWAEGTGNQDRLDGASCWDYLAYDATSPTNWTGGAGIGLDASSSGLQALVATVAVADMSTANVGDEFEFALNATGLSALETWALDGTNAGFLLKTSTDTGNPGSDTVGALFFGSKENATTSYRPELTLNYTIIPEPSTFALLVLAGVYLLQRRRRR